MVSIYQINSINAYFSLLIGISMNIFLLFLSKKYSTGELKEYRSFIKFLTFWNVSMLVAQALTQPVYLMTDNSISLLYVQGLAATIPSVVVRNILAISYLMIVNSMMVTLSLQFVNRYLLFCHPKIGQTLRRFLLASILCFNQIWVISMELLISIPERDIPAEEIPGLANLFSTNELSSIKIAMKFDAKNLGVQIGNGTCLILLLLCYVAIMFAYIRIRAFLRSNIIGGNMSVQKQKTIKQISLNMILQAFLPVYCIILTCMAISSLLTGVQNPLLILLFIPYNWLPILNPLITILTIFEFRIGILKLLGLQKQTQSTTVPMDNKIRNGNGNVINTGEGRLFIVKSG